MYLLLIFRDNFLMRAIQVTFLVSYRGQDLYVFHVSHI